MRLLPLIVALACVLPARAEGPFSDLDFDAATAKAKAESKLLIVDFMASWCGPCKRMDEETWPDAAVGQWIGEHAIAIQVDIDKERELAQRFGFDAIPTVIVLREDTELGRHTDFMGPADLVKWCNELAADKRTDAERIADAIGRLATTHDGLGLYRLGEELVRLGQYDGATEAFVHAFKSGGAEPAPNMWRYREMLDDMVRLVKLHPASKEAFDALIEADQGRVWAKNPPDHKGFYEWVQLCRKFGRTEDILRWYDAKRDDRGRLFGGGPLKDPPLNNDPVEILMLPPQPPPPDLQLDGIREQVVDLLDEAGRVQDALALMEDPVARAREELNDPIYGSFVTAASAENRSRMTAEMLDQKFFVVSLIYARILAGGRTEQANEVAALILPLDTTGMGRTWLVESAVHRGVATWEPCARWLDEAAALGAEDWGLRERLPAPEKAAPAEAPGH